jgi:hypothetical protein
MNGDGVRRVWLAVLSQAIEDLQNERFRYDASQFLFTSNSDLAFRCLDVDPAEFRAKLKEVYGSEQQNPTQQGEKAA